MTIPDSAIEAAVPEVQRVVEGWMNYDDGDWQIIARAAIQAAMPAIRQHIANEIHMALCTDPYCEPVCAGAANAVEVVLEGFEL